MKNNKQNNGYLYIFCVVRFVPKVSDDTLSFVNISFVFTVKICFDFRIHYVIKFVSDLRRVDGFLRVLRFPPPIKLTATI
jgi:hypothetical protein